MGWQALCVALTQPQLELSMATIGPADGVVSIEMYARLVIDTVSNRLRISTMSYIAERRQEEKDRRRAEIVDAAETLYAESGWDSITMDQVARQARLSRALLYVYFRDKEDLLFALVERSLEALRDRFVVGQQGHARGIDEVSCYRPAPTWRFHARRRITSTPAPASRLIAPPARSRTRTRWPAWPRAIACTR